MRSSTWEIIIIRPGLFTNCKRFPENRCWKVNGTQLSGSFQQKISRTNGTGENVLPFSLFRTEYSKLKFVFHFLKAIFDTSFRPKQNAIPVRKWCGYAHAWGIGKPCTQMLLEQDPLQSISRSAKKKAEKLYNLKSQPSPLMDGAKYLIFQKEFPVSLCEW